MKEEEFTDQILSATNALTSNLHVLNRATKAKTNPRPHALEYLVESITPEVTIVFFVGLIRIRIQIHDRVLVSGLQNRTMRERSMIKRKE